jgi:cytochrome P450
MTTHATGGPDVLARLLDPDNLADPYPYLAWVRQNLPVHRHRAGFYLLATHAACRKAARDDLVRGHDPADVPRLYPLAARYRSARLATEALAMKNPPEHSRLRRLFSRDLTPRRLRTVQGQVEHRAGRAVDSIATRLADGETVELYDAVAQHLPEQVIADLVGIPEADRTWLFARFRAVLAAFHPLASEATMAATEADSDDVAGYMAKLIQTRRATPADDLVSAWTQAHDSDPDQFTHQEVLSMLWGLVAGGVVTSSASLGSGVLAMLRYPDAAARWLDGDPADVRRFTDEVVRHESPSFVAGIPRYTVADTEFEGVVVPAGAPVRPMLGSANRDPSAFAEPDRFDPARDTTRSMSFGHGIHYCIGAGLVRIELATLLTTLRRRFPNLVLAGQHRWRAALPVRSLEHLPVALDPHNLARTFP